MKEKSNITDKEMNIESNSMNSDQTDYEREQMIATAAYFRAEKRGFTPDNEQADWYEAENEINIFAA